MTTKEEGLYLLKAYQKFDSLHSLTAAERVRRVLLARKILDFSGIAS
ncbi:hypothetical protein ACFYZH_06600 [Streptomyces abikoensis]